MPATDFLAVLRTLNEHGVDFIVVGGIAAVLEGAPISTIDLGFVHSRTGDNIHRLVRALVTTDAFSRRGRAPRGAAAVRHSVEVKVRNDGAK